jgi:hypothetical protein
MGVGFCGSGASPNKSFQPTKPFVTALARPGPRQTPSQLNLTLAAQGLVSFEFGRQESNHHKRRVNDEETFNHGKLDRGDGSWNVL